MNFMDIGRFMKLECLKKRKVAVNIYHLGRPFVKIKLRKAENRAFVEHKYLEKTNYTVVLECSYDLVQ